MANTTPAVRASILAGRKPWAGNYFIKVRREDFDVSKEVFALDQQGFWLDPSDMDTMSVDHQLQTPVNTVLSTDLTLDRSAIGYAGAAVNDNLRDKVEKLMKYKAGLLAA